MISLSLAGSTERAKTQLQVCLALACGLLSTKLLLEEGEVCGGEKNAWPLLLFPLVVKTGIWVSIYRTRTYFAPLFIIL